MRERLGDEVGWGREGGGGRGVVCRNGGEVGWTDGHGLECGVVEVFGEGIFYEQLLELEGGARDSEVLLARRRPRPRRA